MHKSPRSFLKPPNFLLPLAIFLEFFFLTFHFAAISAQFFSTMGVMDSILSTLGPLTSAAPYHLLAYGTLLGTELYQVCRSSSVYSSKNWQFWKEFCHDINLLSSPSYVGLYHTAEASFSFIFPDSKSSLSSHRGYLSSLWTVFSRQKFDGRYCYPDLRWCHGAVESHRVRPQDSGGHDWENPSRSEQFCSIPWNPHGTNCIPETKDGKKFNDPELSEEMRVKNKAFSHNHAMSIHLNLLAVGATLWYGLRLASKIQI